MAWRRFALLLAVCLATTACGVADDIRNRVDGEERIVVVTATPTPEAGAARAAQTVAAVVAKPTADSWVTIGEIPDRVVAMTMATEFGNDPEKAEAKYQGSALVITGTVARESQNMLTGGRIILFEGPTTSSGRWAEVNCEAPPQRFGERSSERKVEAGDRVTVKGYYKSYPDLMPRVGGGLKITMGTVVYVGKCELL